MDTQQSMNQQGRREPQPAARTIRLGRAAFLAAAAGTGAALFAGKISLGVAVPKLTGLVPSLSSVNGFTIYTVTDGYPAFHADRYRLTVDGMVDRPLTMTIDDILRHPAVNETRFYQCVTG